MRSALTLRILHDLFKGITPQNMKCFLITKPPPDVCARCSRYQGLPDGAYAVRDHHRGLNSLPVTIDRKRWNGMLCLSALWAAQRETIIISSALMLLPAQIHCRCSSLWLEQVWWGRSTHRQAGRWVEIQEAAFLFFLSLCFWHKTFTDRQKTNNHAGMRVDSQPASSTSTGRNTNRSVDRRTQN